jgi:hypothetical protein
MQNGASSIKVYLLNASAVSLIFLLGKPITQLMQTDGTMCAYTGRRKPSQTLTEAGTKRIIKMCCRPASSRPSCLLVSLSLQAQSYSDLYSPLFRR